MGDSLPITDSKEPDGMSQRRKSGPFVDKKAGTPLFGRSFKPLKIARVLIFRQGKGIRVRVFLQAKKEDAVD
jgi:hypothetical protein